MMLECSVRLIALSPANSFARPIQSNIYIGIRRIHIQEPKLVLVTRNSIIEFKLINNVRRIYKKEINAGKIGIEFQSPPHQLLIHSTKEELILLTGLLSKLTNRKIVEKMDHIPVIPSKLKLRVSSKTDPLSNKSSTQQIASATIILTAAKSLPIKINSNLKVLDLPNSNITTVPAELGQVSIQTVNLEGNALTDKHLQWLDEKPIRISLQTLNLAGNQIKSFPSALIDYSSLFSLNLRDNFIRFLPGSIGHLKSLRFLNVSGNNIRFLPATITWLRLEELDLTYNNLTSNAKKEKCDIPRTNILSALRLQDLAAMVVNISGKRRSLTYKDCPRNLLDKLRSMSICICLQESFPYPPAQYYKALLRINFALTYKIYPQKDDFGEKPLHNINREGNGVGNIFLQYHFCNFTDHCKRVRLAHYQTSYACYRLNDD